MKEFLVSNRLQNYSRVFILDKRFNVLQGQFCKYNKKIYGVGRKQMGYLMAKVGLNRKIKMNQVHLDKLVALSDYGKQNFLLERDLRSIIKQNIHVKIKKNLYVGIRLSQGLPSRGQRTRTNAGTAKRLLRTK